MFMALGFGATRVRKGTCHLLRIDWKLKSFLWTDEEIMLLHDNVL